VNKEEILAMKPGREMDALAGKTFDLSPRIRWFAMNEEETASYMSFESQLLAESWHNEMVSKYPNGRYVDAGGHLVQREIYRRYSEDISAAWEVVEKLREIWEEVSVVSDSKGWETFLYHSGDDKYPDDVWVNAQAKTAPEAICKAALLAVMEAE
jgi:hypothetical protein